jgi:hypothetical protein
MVIRILVFFAVFWLFAMNEPLNAAETTECLRQARVLPAAIQSIDYHYSTSGHEHVSRFVIQGASWYYGFAKKAGESTTSEYVFNGTRYEAKVDGEYLSFSEASLLPRGQVHLHPLLRPYTWFTEDSSMLSLYELHDQQKWSSVIEAMKFVGMEIVDGKDCEVYSIEYPQVKHEVSFSIADHGFPVRVFSKKTNGNAGELVAKELLKFTGPVVIAVHLAGTGAKLSQEFMIDKSSLAVNEPIAPGMFSLDPTNVPLIIDVDERKRTKEKFRAEREPKSVWNPWLVVVLVFILVAGIAMWRRTKGV